MRCALTCYANILTTKLLAESICFVNNAQHHEVWAGRRTEPHELLRLLEKHLVLSAFCPSLLHCLSLGELVASALFASRSSSIFVQGLMLCCDCLVRVTSLKSDRMIGCLLGERVGSVFSHSALSLSIHPGLPESWKNTYTSFT